MCLSDMDPIKVSLYLSGLLFSSRLLDKSSVVLLTIEKEFHGLITLVKVICHPSVLHNGLKVFLELSLMLGFALEEIHLVG